MSKMKVVLDTNVLQISLPNISKYRPIFDALLNQKFSLAISEDILQLL
jgi:predicted nucleic acid-binding protein